MPENRRERVADGEDDMDRDRPGTDDIVALHGSALASAVGLVGRVRANQMGVPTPCDGWYVWTLLAHLVGSRVNSEI